MAQTNLFDSLSAPADEHRLLRRLAPKLARTERLTLHELHTHRRPLLASFLGHALRNTDFYNNRINFDPSSPEALDKCWPEIPILTRAEAVANRERLVSRRAPPEAGSTENGQTSGATGMPFRCKISQSLETVSCALTERMFRWWRVDGKKAFAQITQSPPSGAPARGGTVMQGWNSARPTGTKYFLAHRFDIDTQLDWLLARRAAYLASFSGIIKDLALTVQRRGIELKFELLFSCAAPVDAELRALCRSVFGAEIADTYGAREAGHLAAQCPSCGEYHCSSDTAVIEILREDGSPAASGETGRVVVTPLYNYAMPLIRYELGDYAEVGATEPPCGIKLPTLRRILGRHRNLFRFRDGTRVWPVATLFYLHRFMKLTQFQIVQTDFEHIEIRYVPDGVPGPVDLDGLREQVRTVLGQPVEVTVCPVEEIRRTAGKYEDCVSLVSVA
jgi:phenylacetate-CoA ligase